MTSILSQLSMHGYGAYVWSAYGLATGLLVIQGVIPAMRWKKFLKKIKKEREMR